MCGGHFNVEEHSSGTHFACIVRYIAPEPMVDFRTLPIDLSTLFTRKVFYLFLCDPMQREKALCFFADFDNIETILAFCFRFLLFQRLDTGL